MGFGAFSNVELFCIKIIFTMGFGAFSYAALFDVIIFTVGFGNFSYAALFHIKSSSQWVLAILALPRYLI